MRNIYLRAILPLSFSVLIFTIPLAHVDIFAQEAPASSTVPNQTPKHGHGLDEITYTHEDWTKISLEGSTLKTGPVIQAPGTYDLPQNNFVRQLYRVEWRPNDPIDLFIVLPKHVAKPPVVLYLYSYPQDSDRFKNDHWCEAVTDGGVAAVGFVSALTGQRYHDRPMKHWFVSELPESLAESTHDVQLILNYLASRGDLDMDRVGMFGQGSGGAIAILASAADPRIKALDVLMPWGDWPDWLAKSKVVPEGERASFLTPGFLANVAPLDPATWVPKVKAERIRIQDVRTDPSTPVSAQDRLEAAAPERAKIDQFGDSRALYPAAAGGKIFSWIKEQLQSNGKAMADNSPRIQYFPAAGGGPSALPSTK